MIARLTLRAHSEGERFMLRALTAGKEPGGADGGAEIAKYLSIGGDVLEITVDSSAERCGELLVFYGQALRAA